MWAEDMTEAEWLAEEKLDNMFSFLQGKIEVRKLSLFAVAWCRQLPRYLESEAGRRWVELIERDVDGAATEAEFSALTELSDLDDEEWAIPWDWRDGWGAIGRIWGLHSAGLWDNNQFNVSSEEEAQARHRVEGVAIQLLREVVGNPFRQPVPEPSWQNPSVQAITRAIYDGRRWQDMPILADALEEAGCTNEDILAHCRSGGEHVRGCWVVDLLLDKT